LVDVPLLIRVGSETSDDEPESSLGFFGSEVELLIFNFGIEIPQVEPCPEVTLGIDRRVIRASDSGLFIPVVILLPVYEVESTFLFNHYRKSPK
jgi:hypothetical protein